MSTHLTPGSVVVGVDASVHSDEAVRWATSVAAYRSLPLVLVHALGELTPGERMGGAEAFRRLHRMAARRATEQALALVRRLAPGVRVTELHPEGDPRNALVDLSPQASMLVVGSRGHGPVSTLLLGSVSVAVATHARCAVAVVREHAGATSAGDPGDGVVVGVSGDGSDRSAVELAADLASMRGSTLEAVHAWNAGDTFVDTMSYPQRLDAMERHERALAEAVAGLGEKYPDLEVVEHLREDGPVHALVERSRTADCVVVGSRGRSGAEVLLGSVSRSLLERAHGTVVVVRP